jgi:hypothetical protein
MLVTVCLVQNNSFEKYRLVNQSVFFYGNKKSKHKMLMGLSDKTQYIVDKSVDIVYK